MRCPVCGVEMWVKHRTPLVQASKEQLRLQLACRSRQCPRFGQIVAEKIVLASPPALQILPPHSSPTTQ